MKANKDWTYRTAAVTVAYKAGDELHEYAIAAATAAGAVDAVKEEKGKADGNGTAKASAPRNTVNLKG